MQIIRRIPVKHVLTEQSRSKLKNRFDARVKQLEQECYHLTFEQKKLERKPGLSKQEVGRRFSKEISRRKDELRWMEHQLNQLNILPDGSELETDEVEAVLSINEGDEWSESVLEQQIVIKDGIVIRAR
ncbi:YlqD family protein [Halobacillus salinarum]|uniref:YlqD family protein n=1 Tax=Halobacillus salinarum TaxID=2932257 RepID=A0ABY4ELU5_9BACI|nr:YlqD family protein [Halobacillus salinarum]UOQ43076.1 YlqD family protein [Halobacillus salinarum]